MWARTQAVICAGQIGRQPADAGPEVAFLVPDRDDDLHLRAAARVRQWELLPLQALK